MLPSFKNNLQNFSNEINIDLIVQRESRLRTQMGNDLQDTIELKKFVRKFVSD